jgi:hypothetical protein
MAGATSKGLPLLAPEKPDGLRDSDPDQAGTPFDHFLFPSGTVQCTRMIRHRHGSEFLLITQDDHARLSGHLAAHYGNARFAVPSPRRDVVEAVTRHDAGWELHDSEPTLNPQQWPLHVFETPPQISAKVWSESVRRAREHGPYCALLVSLHTLALSALQQQHYSAVDLRPRHAMELFELNKFQQRQIEIQEELRAMLGLRTDLPLTIGLAKRRTSEAEDLLLSNYHILKAMDQVSLALLCSGNPFATIENISSRPGAEPQHLSVGYMGEWAVKVSPWPFDADRIETQVPLRRVPAERFADDQAFRAAYAAAPVEMQTVCVARAT